MLHRPPSAIPAAPGRQEDKMKNIPNYHSTSNRLLLMALAAPPGSIRSHIAAAVVAHSGFFTNDLFRSDPLLSAQIDALLRELAVDFIASPHGELGDCDQPASGCAGLV
jgi:hypothetical protein